MAGAGVNRLSSRGRPRSVGVAWLSFGLCAPAFIAGLLLYAINFDHRDQVAIVEPFVSVAGLAYAFVGALIVARHPRHALGWLFVGLGLTGVLGLLAVQWALYGLVRDPGSLPGSAWALYLGFWATVPGFALQPTLMLLLFPSGRLAGRPTRIVAGVSAIATAGLVACLVLSGIVPPESGELFDVTPSPVKRASGSVLFDPGPFLLLLVVCSLASITILLRRLRRARGVERQQLKWGVFAMAVVVAANILDLVVRGGELPLLVVTGPLLAISAGFVPVAIGMAILRYHLFDIDRVISRALVYAGLTAGLAAIYLLGVLLFQRLLDPLTSGSDIAIAGTTLLVAALARPLRNRIQHVVDRRFYRRHYDAASEIERFAARLREQTDLDALAVEIRGVVNDTMQPSHVTLWIPDRVRVEVDRPGRRTAR